MTRCADQSQYVVEGRRRQPGDNKITPSKGQPTIELHPDPDPVMLHCDTRRWMDGVIRVFDHPYTTVTDKEGSCEIKGVSTGAEVSIVIWHEAGSTATTASTATR
jgi:hypothetical protein